MADDSWRTHSFRQNVVAKIDEVVRSSGMNTSRNSIEMENHVFQKAKTKEDYLGYVARLILHVREINTKKGPPGGMNGVPGGQPQQVPGMPDPINALQNLASQGSRNSMVGMGNAPQPGQMGGPGQGGPNLLQPLNRCSNQQIMMNGMPGNMPMQVPRMQNINMAGNNQMAGQIPLLQGQMGAQMNSGMQMQGPGQMGPGQMGPGQMGPGNMQMGPGGMQGTMAGQMMGSIQQMQPQKPPNNPNAAMLLNPNMMGGGGYVRQPGPNQMFAQSPLQASAQSPAGGGLSQPPSASPALAASPGTPMGMMGAPRPQCMAPSPGASLNTPGQPAQSPMSADDLAYREKVRQLSRFIDPLRKMVLRMSEEEERGEKMIKMKKLLELLTNQSNQQERTTLDTLLKCEVVLEKIDFNRGVVPTRPFPVSYKEPHVFHSLLDAVAQNLQSPVINHTLHRTFGPTLDALVGPEFKLVPPLKKARLEEPTSDIPDVLQGEIARLDQRFKVSLDPNQQAGAKSIKLTCWLDDKHLPCVPPISLTVPEDYPKEPPTCQMTSQEYVATKFLSDVQTALTSRIKKLPKNFSVSHLLDTWEMSVRQASAPSNALSINSLAIQMGL